MKFTLTVLSFLFAVTCIPYAICDKEFYAQPQLLIFGIISGFIWLIFMIEKTIQTKRAIKAQLNNDPIN